MKLNDVRRYAIRKQAKVKFRLHNGGECVVNEHGISTAPGLNRPPDFNFEDELGKAIAFVVEPIPADKAKVRPQSVTRAELEQMVASVGAAAMAAAAAAAHDHDE